VRSAAQNKQNTIYCFMAEDPYNNQDSGNSKFDRLVDHLVGYVDTKVELVKLDAQTKLRDVIVNILHGATLALTGLFTLLFLMITLGLALNDWLDSSFLGFLIVTAIFAIPFLIALMNKDKAAFGKIADGMFTSTDKKENT
jgi:Fe2+ transport system protein B